MGYECMKFFALEWARTQEDLVKWPTLIFHFSCEWKILMYFGCCFRVLVWQNMLIFGLLVLIIAYFLVLIYFRFGGPTYVLDLSILVIFQKIMKSITGRLCLYPLRLCVNLKVCLQPKDVKSYEWCHRLTSSFCA